MSCDIVATLDSVISERSLLKHPFYQAWTAGTLTLERLQNYVELPEFGLRLKALARSA